MNAPEGPRFRSLSDYEAATERLLLPEPPEVRRRVGGSLILARDALRCACLAVLLVILVAIAVPAVDLAIRVLGG